MKPLVRTVTVALLFLAACTKTPHVATNVQEHTVTQDDFLSTLQEEYTGLASYEDAMKNNGLLADHFRHKAYLAERGGNVSPDMPSARTLPDFSRLEMESAYTRLQKVIVRQRGPGNDALLALAQTRFDCWLAYRSIFPEKDATFKCRDDFEAALAQLTQVPEAQPDPGAGGAVFAAKDHYIVAFTKEGTALDDAAMLTVSSAAEQYHALGDETVLLTGYADTSSKSSTNTMLALRRAVAVKNALGQHGVSLEHIVIDPDGQDGKNARGKKFKPGEVMIDLKPERKSGTFLHDITETESWKHIGN